MPSASASADSVGTPSAQSNIDHEPVADAHAVGERLAFFGEEHAAIRPRGRQSGALEA